MSGKWIMISHEYVFGGLKYLYEIDTTGRMLLGNIDGEAMWWPPKTEYDESGIAGFYNNMGIESPEIKIIDGERVNSDK